MRAARMGSVRLRCRMALRMRNQPRRCGTEGSAGASTIYQYMRVWMPLLVCSVLVAQDAPTIKVDVDIVNILFNVRDKHNGLVGSLTKDDFSIFEDAKQQDI